MRRAPVRPPISAPQFDLASPCPIGRERRRPDHGPPAVGERPSRHQRVQLAAPWAVWLDVGQNQGGLPASQRAYSTIWTAVAGSDLSAGRVRAWGACAVERRLGFARRRGAKCPWLPYRLDAVSFCWAILSMPTASTLAISSSRLEPRPISRQNEAAWRSPSLWAVSKATMTVLIVLVRSASLPLSWGSRKAMRSSFHSARISGASMLIPSPGVTARPRCAHHVALALVPIGERGVL